MNTRAVGVILDILLLVFSCSHFCWSLPNPSSDGGGGGGGAEIESRAYYIPPPLDGKGSVRIDDMILTQEYLISAKNGLINTAFRWPSKTVIYFIDPKFTPAEKLVINGAINEIQSKTCIRFKARTTEQSYVNIARSSPGGGCSSYVGRVPTQYQPQRLNLQSPGCVYNGIVVHELTHAIGFEHEQCRSDRDNYVTINYQNIQQGFAFAFDKYGPSRVSSFGVPYDYGSVMHYGRYDFSRNGQPTIVPKQTGVQIGQRKGLSSSDALKINRMYGC